MRLIDADELKAMVNKDINRCYQLRIDGVGALAHFIDEINSCTTVDAVKVVRCKDCVYWGQDACSSTGDDESFCTNPDGLDNFAHPDDFCSYGERRNEDA